MTTLNVTPASAGQNPKATGTLTFGREGQITPGFQADSEGNITAAGNVVVSGNITAGGTIAPTGSINSTDAVNVRRANSFDNCFTMGVTGDAVARGILDASGKLNIGTGALAPDTNLYRVAADTLASDDDMALQTAGKGYRVKEGANAKMGLSTLVAGTLVVANTSITATSRIFLTAQTTGGTPGFLRVSARVVGTSFTILSSNAADTSDVAWLIMEPS